MLTLMEYINNNKFVTKKELNQIENYLDQIFKAVGIDVEFSPHFLERINDARNGKQITREEIINLYKKEYQKYGKVLAQLKPSDEAVLTDLSTSINAPIVMKFNKNKKEIEMMSKSVMRKKNFVPHDRSEKQYKVA